MRISIHNWNCISVLDSVYSTRSSCAGGFLFINKITKGYFPEKMPADIMEKNSSSPVAATPASMNTTPDKPKTASEHRKVGIDIKLRTIVLQEVVRQIDSFCFYFAF